MMKQISDEIQYCKEQTRALDSLFLHTQVSGNHISLKNIPHMDTKLPCVISNAVCNIEKIDATHINEQMDNIAAAVQSAELSDPDENSSRPSPETLSEIATLHLAMLKFSPQQEQIIYKVKEYLEALVAARNNPQLQLPKPFKILLTGGPGTGKSFVIETICNLVKWLQTGKVTTSSWNGIAAVNIDGSTLCSMLNIRPTDRKASSVEKGYIAPIGSIDILQKM
jgi:hypothetical protein